MVTDGKKWHYLAVKSFSAFFCKITSNHKEDFYYLNCFHSYSTKDTLKKHNDVCKSHDYCYVKMPKEVNEILKYKHGEKSMKVPFIIYADLEPLLEKMNTCHNNSKKSSTTKMNKHRARGYSLFTNCSFDTTKNKLDYYRGKNCMKNFFVHLKEHATKIVDCEKKEMIPLINEEKNYIASKKDLVLMMAMKNITKLEIIVITQENIEELLMIIPI